MPKAPITLYTSKPTDGGFRALAALLSAQQPVRICPLAELPPPDLTRRQRRQAELVGLRAQLDAVLYLIQVAENNPKRYGHLLCGLRRERDHYELHIEQLQLGLQQKGGPANG